MRSSQAKAATAAAASEPLTVTLELTPAAHAILTAMAAYRDEPSVEACILSQLSDNVVSWFEGVSNNDDAAELFLSGAVATEKGGG